MTGVQWKRARQAASLTQAVAARSLGVSQPYLSQLESASRQASPELAQKAAVLYGVPTVVPVPRSRQSQDLGPDDLQRELAELGYPGFAHIALGPPENPARVVLSAIVQKDLDTRLVEALPWVMSKYTDLDWGYLRDQAKLRNAQNRLGYVVHLAKCVVASRPFDASAAQTLDGWETELEEARLAKEDTLCRESMPQRERRWIKEHRSPAAAHWNLLTSLTPEQLSYVK